jgi:transcriptional/translational regulatory protein YebC/TACO1
MIPQNYVSVTDESNLNQLNRILDLLDEDDDIQAVYTNLEEE